MKPIKVCPPNLRFQLGCPLFLGSTVEEFVHALIVWYLNATRPGPGLTPFAVETEAKSGPALRTRLGVEYPRYKSHKEVQAVKIASVVKHAHPDPKADDAVFEASPVFQGAHLWPVGGFALIPVNADWYRKHRPEEGGYYVIYEDGYTSFSPAKAFEGGYTRIDDGPVPVDNATAESLRAGRHQLLFELRMARDAAARAEERLASLERLIDKATALLLDKDLGSAGDSA